MGNSFSHFRKQSLDQRDPANGRGQVKRDALAKSRKPLKERLRRFTRGPAVPYPARYSLLSSTVLSKPSVPPEPFKAPSPARFHKLPPGFPVRNENSTWEDTLKLYDNDRQQINSHPVPLVQHQHVPFLPNFIQASSVRSRKFKSTYRDDVVFPRNTRSSPAKKKAKQLERTRQIHAPRVRQGRGQIFGGPMEEVDFAGETVVPSDELASRRNSDLSVFPSSSILPTAPFTPPLPGDDSVENLSPVHPSSITSIPIERVSRPASATITSTLLPQSSSQGFPSPVQTPPQAHRIDDLNESEGEGDSALVPGINIGLNHDLVPEPPGSSGTSIAEESEHYSLMLSFIKPYLDFAESRMSSTYGQQEKNWEKVFRSLHASLTRPTLNEEQYLSLDYLLGLINDTKPGNEFNVVRYLRRLALYWNFREIAKTYFNPLVLFERI
jgi:hypothetical protein